MHSLPESFGYFQRQQPPISSLVVRIYSYDSSDCLLAHQARLRYPPDIYQLALDLSFIFFSWI